MNAFDRVSDIVGEAMDEACDWAPRNGAKLGFEGHAHRIMAEIEAEIEKLLDEHPPLQLMFRRAERDILFELKDRLGL